MFRILIAEDERIIAEDLKHILQGWGHNIVDIVASGEEAFEVAIASKPDLIFMDIMLEGKLNGIETARKIINEIDVNIVFCSAYSDDFTLLRASAVNPAGYIIKPFELEEIEKLINWHLDPTENGFMNDLRIDRTADKQEIC